MRSRVCAALAALGMSVTLLAAVAALGPGAGAAPTTGGAVGVAARAADSAASTTTSPGTGSPSSTPGTKVSGGAKGARLLIVALVFGALLLVSQRIRRAAHPRRPGDEKYRLIPPRDRRRPPPRRGKRPPPD